MFGSTSPDGRYRLIATERADFPANEMLDPSATLRIDLTNGRGEMLDECFIGQYEYGDFNEGARVIWEKDGHVRVLDIDRTGHGLSAILDAHAFQRQREVSGGAAQR